MSKQKKMNPEVKAKWLKALRSGKYHRGTNCLRIGDKFCPLGVLCDIHRKETGEGKWKRGSIMSRDDNHYSYSYNYNSGDFLPKQVMKWAGLTSSDPFLNYGDRGYERVYISELNDRDQLSFRTMAKLIEAQL